MKNLEAYDAVIFDMDGVLIDSEPLWKIAMEQTFLEVGCNLTREDFASTAGMRIDEVIVYWFNRLGWEGLSAKEVENRIIDRMVHLIENEGKPLDGVVETLQYLKSNGKLIGLGTSSYTVLMATVLRTLNIQDYFNFVHSAEYETYGKPHPAVYLTVAEKLGMEPTKCLVIEDSLNGLIAAKAAKMGTVCIPERGIPVNPKFIIADYQFESMQEMLKEISPLP